MAGKGIPPTIYTVLGIGVFAAIIYVLIKTLTKKPENKDSDPDVKLKESASGAPLTSVKYVSNFNDWANAAVAANKNIKLV